MSLTSLYRTVAILTAILLLVAGCANAATEKSESGFKGPKIVFEKETIDAGKIPFDQTVKVDFPFRNAGTEALMITQQPTVRALEGC